MNRNTNSRFAVNPVNIDVPRSQFKRDSDHLLSGSVGQLIPFYVDEKLPGDTDKITTSKVIRFNTLLKPIFGNLYADFYYFFVPNRLIMDKWKNFCGESEKAWRPQLEYAIPQIGCDETHPHPGVGSLADYLGVPLTFDGTMEFGDTISALPFRAYAKICNDWFRSEALQDELVIPTGQETATFNAITDDDLFCAYGGPLFKVGKFHDYFTSCLPEPQNGPAVKIPVSGNSPSEFYPVTTRNAAVGSPGNVPLSGILKGTLNPGSSYALYGFAGNTPGAEGTASVFASSSPTSGVNGGDFVPSNLWASVGITVGTISELRMAFQVQKYYEKLNGGRRYIEVLKNMFGVTSPDARLQRSEYLGGNRVRLNVSEVTANAQSDEIDLGDLAGMSRTSDVNHDFVHSYTEHGYVIGVMCVRYEHTYPQGLDRHWLRYSTFDYYWPVFSNISNQPVYQAEINYSHAGGVKPRDVFGYQEAWADYRFKRSTCAGYMRPEAPTSLSSWHLADYYDPDTPGPFLSAEWLNEDAGNVDRVLAVSSNLTHQFTADIFVRNMCTRVMPMFSIPGLADHH